MSSGPEKSIRPFVFEQSFDSLPSPEELETIKQEEEEEAAPTFSEEELQAARAHSYKQGLQAGLQEATTGIEQQVATTLDVLAGTLDRLTEQQQQANELISRESIGLAVAAVSKLLPELIHNSGSAEVEKFVCDIMSRILEEPRITIRVAYEILPEIQRNLNDLTRRIGFSGILEVTGDSELGPADCRIRWSEGDAERIIEATLREIEALSQAVPRHTPTTALEIGAQLPAPLPIDGMEAEITAEAETAPEVAATEIPESLNVTDDAVPMDAETLAAEQGTYCPPADLAESSRDPDGEIIDIPHSELDQEATIDDVSEMSVNPEPT